MANRIFSNDIQSRQVLKRHLKSASGFAEIKDSIITGDYSPDLDDAVIPVDGEVNISLPSLSTEGINGKRYFIKNLGFEVVSVIADGSDTIDGENIILLTSQYDDMQIVAGNEWHII